MNIKGRTMAKKVLLVDDDPDILVLNQTVVEENGFEPVTAENGEQGLALARSEKPDAIVLDILMPRQSGIKMYRALKLDDTLKDIPVVVLSGIARKSFLKSQDILSGSDGRQVPEPEIYLEKPVSPDMLADAIRKVLAGK